jgi:hypothetical protein
MDAKLRVEGCALIGSNGKVIRDLFGSEMAGLMLCETFKPSEVESYLKELLPRPQ